MAHFLLRTIINSSLLLTKFKCSLVLILATSCVYTPFSQDAWIHPLLPTSVSSDTQWMKDSMMVWDISKIKLNTDFQWLTRPIRITGNEEQLLWLRNHIWFGSLGLFLADSSVKNSLMVSFKLLLIVCWAGNPENLPLLDDAIFLFSTQLFPNTSHYLL